MTQTQVTIADLIAVLAQFPGDIPLTLGTTHMSVQQAVEIDLEDPVSSKVVGVSLHGWNVPETEASTIMGLVTHLERSAGYDKLLDGGQAFVYPVVEQMKSFPANSNPFHHDLGNMGTSLVSDWVVMHPGYDHKDSPRAMTYVHLVNTRSGQRFRVDMSRAMPEGRAELLRK